MVTVPAWVIITDTRANPRSSALPSAAPPSAARRASRCEVLITPDTMPAKLSPFCSPAC